MSCQGEPNFDGIARAYRWMEYVTLGRALERARECHLCRLGECRQALVLGDGDGRFTAKLLRSNSSVAVEAVDRSAAMLRLLGRRSEGCAGRLRVCVADARTYVPASRPDLVATHFFLDCFGQEEVERMVSRMAERMTPGGVWVVTEFCLPCGRLRLPAALLIRGLYLGFRILTGLRTTRLPDHGRALRKAGLELEARRSSLWGLLTSEVWRRR